MLGLNSKIPGLNPSLLNHGFMWGGVENNYILRSRPANSYQTHLTTLAYRTELLSKSGRAFLTLPGLSFLPHLLLCTSSSSSICRLHFSQGAIFVIAFCRCSVSSTWNLPLFWKTSIFILQNSSYLSLCPESLLWCPIPRRALPSSLSGYLVWDCCVCDTLLDALADCLPVVTVPEPVWLFRY